jgi:hypothetical protein
MGDFLAEGPFSYLPPHGLVGDCWEVTTALCPEQPATWVSAVHLQVVVEYRGQRRRARHRPHLPDSPVFELPLIAVSPVVCPRSPGIWARLFSFSS